jgi:hypothetical protein
MAQDANEKISDRKDELLRDELDNFKNAYYKRTGKTNNSLSWI